MYMYIFSFFCGAGHLMGAIFLKSYDQTNTTHFISVTTIVGHFHSSNK